VSDGIVRGQLEIEGPVHQDASVIRIGGVRVRVGGNGLEVSSKILSRLGALEGTRVIAGVHDIKFPNTTVQVLAVYSDVVAIGSASAFSELADLRSSLRCSVAWNDIVRLERGQWDTLQRSVAEMGDADRDRAVQRYLESGDPLSIAEDVCGWLASAAGRDVSEWSEPSRVTLRGERLQVATVRHVAQRIGEVCLDLPAGFLTRFHWGVLEQYRRLWALIELRKTMGLWS
jgi:hypothetical protein